MRRVRISGRISKTDPTTRIRDVQGIEGSGRTLGSYLEEFEGPTCKIDDPLGTIHEVSLEPFSDADPSSFLQFSFVFPLEGVDFPDLVDGEVVLKEFELPGDIELPWESSS